MVALLRGVNVGGRNRLAMADLRAAAVAAGCEQVRTYIQSGNVVFTSPTADPTEVGERLAREIAEATPVHPDVVVRTRDELYGVMADNPFVDRADDVAHLHVAFVGGTAAASLGPLDTEGFPPEEAAVVGRQVHLLLPDGMARSKLATAVVRALDGDVTVRNWRTVTRLVAMADEVT